MTISPPVDPLEAAANVLGIVAPDVGTGTGKAYEAWFMLALAVRLRQAGIGVFPHDHNDDYEPWFRIAGGPSNMPAAGSASANAPCHFLLWPEGQAFELHLGLQHRCATCATHDIHLSDIRAHYGRAVRASGGGPFPGAGEVGVELKAYDAKHKLPQHFPRALIGIAVDLDPSRTFEALAIHTAGGEEIVYHRRHRTHYAIVSTTSLYDNSRRLIEHHGGSVHSFVEPGNDAGTLDYLRDIILAALA